MVTNGLNGFSHEKGLKKKTGLENEGNMVKKLVFLGGQGKER